MTSKIIVNTIEADTGISSVTFASNINLQNDSSVLVSSSGIRLGTGSTIAAPSANEISLSTNSAERLRVTSGGKISINNTNPLSDLHVTTTGSSGQDGTFRVGGSVVSLGLVLDYDQSSATVSRITANPTYTNTNSLLKICVDGDANPDQLVLRGDGNVGVNVSTPERKLEVVDTNTNGSYPLAVSNFINATANRGAAIDFRLTTGGNTRGEIGCTWTSNSSSDGTVFYFAPNDGSTGNIERLRLTGDGKFGFNTTNPGAFNSGANHLVLLGNTSGTGNAGITIASGTDSYGNIYFADGTSGADAYRGHIAYNHNGNTMRFATNGAEKFRITSDGKFGFNATNPPRDYCFHSGQADTNIQITNNTTGIDDSAGALIQQDGNDLYIWNKENSFMSLGTNAAERMRITSSGYVIKSNTPAFKCKLSSATGANFTGYFVFGNVSYNIGSHYNSSNGRFTAPVDGRYLFAWYTNMERAGGNGSFYAEWYINGNAQGNRMYSHHSGAWELIGGTVIFDLNANDYVQIRAMTSGNWDGGQYGSYSGYLLG